MPGKTTRRTTNKKITVKVKPTKAKKPRKKGGSKTLTAALNTYKSVKNKIVGDGTGKARRQEKRATRKANRATPEYIDDIPVLKRLGKVDDGNHSELKPQRTTGIDYGIDDVVTTYNDDEGPRDPRTGLLYNHKFGEEGTLRDLEITATRKKKKNNNLLYLALALLVAFAVYKMAKKK